MQLKEIKLRIPEKLYDVLQKERIKELRPAQIKAIKKGLFNKKNLLVCTPTASGKTLIAELAAIKTIIEDKSKVVYIVPLKALANEKFKDFKRKYPFIKVALSIGDLDSSDNYLLDYDFIICTSEKLDSLIRHHAPWLSYVSLIIIDEIHLMNDSGRGPTLEILITMLRLLLVKIQIIALSATIGNPEELAKWLNANLVIDNWRPVKLYKGVYFDDVVELK
jgi:helicase